MFPLPLHFVPGPFDVICARGREAKNHEGNRRYRVLVEKALPRYSQATSKIDKSMIVSDIVEAVQNASPEGGFVKEENGQYYNVGERGAREKIGQSLRDSLHSQYKSSTKAKRKFRREVHAGIANDLESLIHANEIVSSRMQRLSADIETPRNTKNFPEVLGRMFTQANLDILEAFKRDAKLLKQFNQVEQEQKLMCTV